MRTGQSLIPQPRMLTRWWLLDALHPLTSLVAKSGRRYSRKLGQSRATNLVACFSVLIQKQHAAQIKTNNSVLPQETHRKQGPKQQRELPVRPRFFRALLRIYRLISCLRCGLK